MSIQAYFSFTQINSILPSTIHFFNSARFRSSNLILQTSFKKKSSFSYVNILKRSIVMSSKLEDENKNEITRSSEITRLIITTPDDFHLHLRDGESLASVLPFSSAVFGRAIIMPNLRPPVTTAELALQYRERILSFLPPSHSFEPLMTLYLTDNTSPQEIELAKQSGFIHGVKFYPSGVTTNSEFGVTDIFAKCFKTLDKMQTLGMPLLIHGEVSDPTVDIFDREKKFIEKILQPLIQTFPNLKIVMEHITTSDAADFILSSSSKLAGTVTPQHLTLNRNSLFANGIRPHNFCLPILKRESHRQALVKAVTSGSEKFFAGTDSAPHEKNLKENSCGCAGVFNSHAAISIYASVFEKEGSLHNLEKFTSHNGADFYGLARNFSEIHLIKREWEVPQHYAFGANGKVVPMFAGEIIQWDVEERFRIP